MTALVYVCGALVLICTALGLLLRHALAEAVRSRQDEVTARRAQQALEQTISGMRLRLDDAAVQLQSAINTHAEHVDELTRVHAKRLAEAVAAAESRGRLAVDASDAHAVADVIRESMGRR